MPKSKPTHPEGQTSVIPRIERLLTEQTSVILQAVDEKLSAQDQKIESRFAALDRHLEERLVAQDIRILAAVPLSSIDATLCQTPTGNGSH